MSSARKYQKSLTQKWCLRFKTKHPESTSYDGIVLLEKPSFIVLQEESNFEFDGLIILPKKVITGYRDAKYEKCTNEIIRENGAIKKLRLPTWLATCQTLKQILTELMERGIWPAVEEFTQKENDTYFYIGPINDITTDGFYLYCYDAAGKWEREYYVKFQDIFRIEINSKYCKHFNHYMKSR